ncbi:NADH-quinone oxidoreductase subunit NuoE [Bosea beijingensis]|jgi:NADH-quinone oxidoreductase subunit E
MSVRRLAPDPVQPASFAFTAANENWIVQQIAKYPEGRQASAVIPLLWKAQEQEGWVSRAVIETVAKRLGMAPMRVLEVATFYTMFNLQPVGEFFVQLCGTTPCALRGAEALKKVCEDVIGPQSTVTADGKLSWLEVECLGACCNAPMAQINVDYYEDLTPANFRQLLDDLRNGRATKPGPQNGRTGSEPEGGPQTLTDKALYDGSMIGAGDWQKRIVEQRKAAAEAAAAKAAAEAEAKKAAEAEAKKAEATPAAVAEKPASETAAAKGKVEKKDVAEAAKPAVDESKPELLAAARGGKGDDLELIWGVGPKLGKMLNEMGVWHYDQIAKWTPAELAWVDARLTGFKGRAERDDWIAQSKKLATGWRPESKLGDKPAE